MSFSKGRDHAHCAALLEDLRGRLHDRGLGFEISEAAVDKLADDGYDPAFGARPLKRTLQREVETPAAMEVLRGGFGPGAALHVDVATGGADDGGLKVEIR